MKKLLLWMIVLIMVSGVVIAESSEEFTMRFRENTGKESFLHIETAFDYAISFNTQEQKWEYYSVDTPQNKQFITQFPSESQDASRFFKKFNDYIYQSSEEQTYGLGKEFAYNYVFERRTNDVQMIVNNKEYGDSFKIGGNNYEYSRKEFNDAVDNEATKKFVLDQQPILGPLHNEKPEAIPPTDDVTATSGSEGSTSNKASEIKPAQKKIPSSSFSQQEKSELNALLENPEKWSVVSFMTKTSDGKDVIVELEYDGNAWQGRNVPPGTNIDLMQNIQANDIVLLAEKADNPIVTVVPFNPLEPKIDEKTEITVDTRGKRLSILPSVDPIIVDQAKIPIEDITGSEIASTDDLTQERNSILYDYVNGIIPPDEFDRKIKELKSRGGNLVINEEFMIGAKKDREESAREAINEYIKSKKLPEKERNALLAYNNDNPTAIFNAQTQSFDDGTKFAGTGFIHTKEGKLQKITALNSKGKLVTLVDNPNSRFASDTNSALTNVKDTIQGRSAVVNALTILSQKGASFSSDAAPLYDGSRFIFDVEGFNTQIVTPNAEGGVLLQEVALGNVVRKREYDAAGGITSDVTDPGTGNARGFRIDGDNYIVSDGTSSMSFETKLDELGYRLIKVGDSWRGSNGLFFDDEGKKITDEDTLEKLKDTFDKRLEKEEVDEDAVDRVMEEERFINQFKFTSEDRWRKILGSGDNVFKVGFDVFTEVIGGYEQYRGIGAFGSLFIGDDELNERRDKVNQAFCDTVVLGGQECWSSVMCSKYSDHVAGSGFLSAETPGQGLRGVAHVEAEKTTTTGPNGTVYLYKITYKVNNPNDNILGYNLFFDYPEGRFTWFTTPQLIPKLQSDSRLGSAALVAYSERVYTQVCLGFTGRLDVGPATGSLSKHSPFIKAASGAKVGQVCSPVVNAFGVAGPTINIPSGAVTTNQTQRNNGEGF